MKTKEKSEFLNLKAKGLPLRDIAKELNISLDTALRFNTEFKLDVQNLDALSKEATKKKIMLLIDNQIKQFTEQLETINKEIKKRDLSDISTDKLIIMQLKQLEFLMSAKPDKLTYFTGERGIKIEDIHEQENLY